MIEGHDSRAVANEILKVAKEKALPITLMQLLKLLFFAHGWSLAMLNKPLSKHQAEAWQYGPVFPPVYKAFSGSGSTPITQMISNKDTGMVFMESFDDNEKETIRDVVEGYGATHAYALSKMTHEDGTPWARTVKELGLYSTIPDEWIKEYFSAIRSAA